uniref:Uncharacterized protein n=1 Tax=Meloidogyne enterolobii TaxID=390850 RepID=A0A6V7Y4N8_MELEN|nr:unnamed protein product [Meloidogyne enterolobii]
MFSNPVVREEKKIVWQRDGCHKLQPPSCGGRECVLSWESTLSLLLFFYFSCCLVRHLGRIKKRRRRVK